MKRVWHTRAPTRVNMSATTSKPRSHDLGRLLLRLLGPVLLVVVLLRLDDPLKIHRTMAEANWALLATAILLNGLVVHLKVVRWRLLLARSGYRYPLGRAWLAFLASAYVALLTPGRVGDVLRVRYLKRDLGVPYAEGLASVVMDRFCDLYVLAAFVAGAAVHFAPVLAPELRWATWVCVAATALGPLVLLLRGPQERVLGGAFRALDARLGAGNLEDGFHRFSKALRANLGGSLGLTLPISVLAFLVNYAQGAMIAAAMGIDVSFVDVSGLLAIASLLGLLPITLSGVGVREALFAVVFPALGHSAEAGVSFGLLVFAVIYLATTIAGFVAWQVAPPSANAH